MPNNCGRRCGKCIRNNGKPGSMGATGASGIGRGTTGATGPAGGATGATGLALLGATGASGLFVIGATGVGLLGATGASGLFVIGATGASGLSVIGATGVGGVTELGAFFGMTAGPSNTGTNNYPGTISSSAIGPSVAGLSAINFPRLMVPSIGGIIINNPGPAQTNNTEFILPSVGTYRVKWHISVDEPAQFSLWISTDGNGTIIAPIGVGGTFSQIFASNGVPSQVGQADLTAQLTGDTIFNNPVAGAAIQVRNYASSAGTVTVTPLPGGTEAQSVVLIIQRLV